MHQEDLPPLQVFLVRSGGSERVGRADQKLSISVPEMLHYTPLSLELMRQLDDENTETAAEYVKRCRPQD